ncbi:MAG: thermonuclease family protein [Leptospiraceae bacterium]|nr:thermonuclease family protein [Leptospiraceae bacterium]
MLSKSEYKALLSEITSIYQSSLEDSDSDWNKSILYGNWSIGKKITELFDSTDSRYGEEIITSLSKDLNSKVGKGFSPRNLRSFHKFYKTYPKTQINPILSWSHYSILITIEDPKQRKSLETKAIQKKLSFRDLRSLTLSKKTSDQAYLPDLLPRPELNLYQYKLIYPFPENPSLLFLDLGFDVSINLPPSYGTVATVPSYTYKAHLKRVIDGDTLEVLIDLGFSNYITQRLRLKSLDTPELPTPEGVKAKKFVEKSLKDSKFLIIKTHSHDKYDRYLVDVFYLPGDVTEEDVIQKGRFLNQEILDEGMGRVW